MPISKVCGSLSRGRDIHCSPHAAQLAIQLSEHFVYIENQFFITSTVVEGIVIENQIGDALVNRIIQAHEEGTPWRACIVIPSLPGYPFPIDTDAASSVGWSLSVHLLCYVDFSPFNLFRFDSSSSARTNQSAVDPTQSLLVSDSRELM